MERSDIGVFFPTHRKYLSKILPPFAGRHESQGTPLTPFVFSSPPQPNQSAPL
jgi:hypothetical protein